MVSVLKGIYVAYILIIFLFCALLSYQYWFAWRSITVSYEQFFPIIARVLDTYPLKAPKFLESASFQERFLYTTQDYQAITDIRIVDLQRNTLFRGAHFLRKPHFLEKLTINTYYQTLQRNKAIVAFEYIRWSQAQWFRVLLDYGLLVAFFLLGHVSFLAFLAYLGKDSARTDPKHQKNLKEVEEALKRFSS